MSVNSLSTLILILVHDKIHFKMECEYIYSCMNNRSIDIPGGKGCFCICAGVSHHHMSDTITYREMFVGILKVA